MTASSRRKDPARRAAYQPAPDPHRDTGTGGRHLHPADPGYAGGNEWIRDAVAATAELARRVRNLLGARGHG